MTTLNIEQFNPKKAEIIALVDKHRSSLEVEIVDNKTYDIVHKSEMELRASRVSIEKQGKEMREDANAFIKAVRQVELDLLAPIEEVEEQLKAKKKAYNDEQERIKREEEAKKQQEIADRTIALAKYGISYDTLTHSPQIMPIDTFNSLIQSEEIKFQEKEKDRIEQEEKDRIEREKFLEDQRKFQEEREKLEADKRAIQEEKDRIEREKQEAENEKKRQAELEQAREQARLQAIEEEKRRVENEKIQAEKKLQQEEEEKRIEEEKLAKKKKYQEFLSSIGYSQEESHLWTFSDTPEGRKFYKFIGIFKND